MAKLFCLYFFLYLDDVKLFLALVDMIVIIVDDMIEANYRIILYPLLQKPFFFAVFVFSINRKQQMIFLEKITLSPGLLS